MPLRRFDSDLRHSKKAATLIGVDEAGRGPWAGPVVTAAVELPLDPSGELLEARDSKALSPDKREALFKVILKQARVFFDVAGPREIDRDNILRATLSSMGRAVKRLQPGDSTLVVVDGNREIPGLDVPQLTVVDGDKKSLSVAAASIVAKVVRDRRMRRLALRYPGYGFAEHKGYGTPKHREALRRLGPCPIHRRSYKPVKEVL